MSAGPTVVGGGLTAVLLTPTLPAPHAQSQGGHVAPGAQLGQAHVQVRPPLPPVTPPHAPPAPQAHVHGEQVSPGAHAGQSQVHVPPPPLPGGRVRAVALDRGAVRVRRTDDRLDTGAAAAGGVAQVAVTTGVAGLPGRAKVDRLRRGPQARPGTARVGLAQGAVGQRGARIGCRADAVGTGGARRAVGLHGAPLTAGGGRARGLAGVHAARIVHERHGHGAVAGLLVATGGNQRRKDSGSPHRGPDARAMIGPRVTAVTRRRRPDANARPLKNLIAHRTRRQKVAASDGRAAGAAAIEQRGRDHHAARTVEQAGHREARQRSDDAPTVTSLA